MNTDIKDLEPIELSTLKDVPLDYNVYAYFRAAKKLICLRKPYKVTIGSFGMLCVHHDKDKTIEFITPPEIFRRVSGREGKLK